MVKFPLQFTVNADAKSGIRTVWACHSGNHPKISCAIPPEFGGPGDGGYSPEDLFALSVLNCMIATFKVYGEMAKIQYSEISGSAKATLNKHPSNSILWISDIEFTLEVKGSSDKEKAKSLLDKAIHDCAISNSIKSAKSFHLNVT